MRNHNFDAIIEEIRALHWQKNKDYGTAHDPYQNVRGSEDWGVKPWMGAMIRLTDKIRRLQKYAKDGQLANESAEDSFKDIIVYAAIALDLFRQDKSYTIGPVKEFAANQGDMEDAVVRSGMGHEPIMKSFIDELGNPYYARVD